MTRGTLPQRPQLPPQHLAGRGHRQALGELHKARIFMRGELHFHKILDLARQRIAWPRTPAAGGIFDYGMDGDLDMHLQNHSVHTSRSYGNSSLRFDHDSLTGGRLFRNDVVNGKHIFHDVTKEAGIYNSQIGYGLGVNICDINNDSFLMFMYR